MSSYEIQISTPKIRFGRLSPNSSPLVEMESGCIPLFQTIDSLSKSLTEAFFLDIWKWI